MMVPTEQHRDGPDVQVDLALAAELQAALLPTSRPPCCEHQHIAALNRMCGSVGGDFYDFIRINEDQVAIVIGDVVGHGVQAALMMARIMGMLRSDVARASRPRDMILQLNELLLDLGDRTGSVLPCSLFYTVIDAPSGVSFFINAGHPMPFLCDRDQCAALHLGPRNILLGVEDFQPREGCHTFVPGERLVLYTDGILDAAAPDGDRFDEQRLHDVVNRNLAAPPEELARAIFTAVEEFRLGARQTDDETIVVVDRI
ncbi:MAG TPA: SpoIIE family protein phosphatase [Phycisphaerae bacterium]|nr:SpoIIE family protein phosphatase [Phycisphaerae bacterium]